MIDKIIVWFRNNWFLWVVLIAGYIVIRAFGYDIKVINPQAVEKAKIQEDTINDDAKELVDFLDFPVTQNDLVRAYNLLLPYSNNKRGMDILNAYKNNGKIGHTDLTTTLKYIPTIGVQSTDVKNKLVNLVNRMISGTNGNRPITTDKKLNDDVEEMIDLLDFPVSESDLIDAYNLYLPYSKNGKGEAFLKLYEKSGFAKGTLENTLDNVYTSTENARQAKEQLIDKINMPDDAPIDNTKIDNWSVSIPPSIQKELDNNRARFAKTKNGVTVIVLPKSPEHPEGVTLFSNGVAIDNKTKQRGNLLNE